MLRNKPIRLVYWPSVVTALFYSVLVIAAVNRSVLSCVSFSVGYPHLFSLSVRQTVGCESRYGSDRNRVVPERRYIQSLCDVTGDVTP